MRCDIIRRDAIYNAMRCDAKRYGLKFEHLFGFPAGTSSEEGVGICFAVCEHLISIKVNCTQSLPCNKLGLLITLLELLLIYEMKNKYE